MNKIKKLKRRFYYFSFTLIIVITIHSCCYLPLVDCVRFIEFRTIDDKNYVTLKINSDSLRIVPFPHYMKEKNENVYEIFINVQYESDSIFLSSGIIDSIELYSIANNDKYKFDILQENFQIKKLKENIFVTERTYSIEFDKKGERVYEKRILFDLKNIKSITYDTNINFELKKYKPN